MRSLLRHIFSLLFVVMPIMSSCKTPNEQALKRAIQSTVYIRAGSNLDSEDSMSISNGTGIVFDKEGYIITCYHIIRNSDVIIVATTKDTLQAEVIGCDTLRDLAVLKVNKRLKAANIDWNHKYLLTETIYTIGYPLGVNLNISKGIVTGRLNSSFFGFSSNIDFVESDAVLNPGNSGGGLLNEDFQLIGINNLMISYTGYYMGYSFAIPINVVKRSIDNIMRTHKRQIKAPSKPRSFLFFSPQ